MNKSNIILASKREGLGWIRCEGKGSFANSPRLKDWSDRQLRSGLTHLVVDLEACTGMDSTFMGTMAGIAMRIARVEGGLMEVASANEKNSRSLDDLGLSALMLINPPKPSWEGEEEEIRSSLVELGAAGATDNTQHVFDAHQTLVDADDSNTEKFSTVLDCLEAELRARNSEQHE
ncbi:STAS domain-containing protein [Rubritalea spongiae]|uniref:STAS domain-containing protein n=1 Tax=Rubritalea spongiae TaxID=430797 RepID=A0ABW5E4A0_9BACT